MNDDGEMLQYISYFKIKILSWGKCVAIEEGKIDK